MPDTEPHTTKTDHDTDVAPARKAEREHGKPDQLKTHTDQAENRQEALLDEGLEESFPASDPVSAKRIT